MLGSIASISKTEIMRTERLLGFPKTQQFSRSVIALKRKLFEYRSCIIFISSSSNWKLQFSTDTKHNWDCRFRERWSDLLCKITDFCSWTHLFTLATTSSLSRCSLSLLLLASSSDILMAPISSRDASSLASNDCTSQPSRLLYTHTHKWTIMSIHKFVIH